MENDPFATQYLPTQLEEALKLARQAGDEGEVPVGAVVVRDGKIIGRGYNRRETDHDPLSHAEMNAIRDACSSLGDWRLSECILVVTLEPCPMCLAACQQARMGHVFFGALDPKGGALSLGYRLNEDARTNHRFGITQISSKKSGEECGKILSNFFKNRRTKN